MANEVVVGPVLGFRGLKEGRWLTSALVVIKGDTTPPQLKLTIGAASLNQEKAILLKTFKDRHAWRLEWGVEQTNAEQPIDYSINDGPTFRYVVPERDKPLRIAYGSCFGFSDIKSMKKVKEKHGTWEVLRQKQAAAKPFHLLLMGGDQVYADEMFVTIAPLRAWFDKSIKKRIQAPFTAEMERLTERFTSLIFTVSVGVMKFRQQ